MHSSERIAIGMRHRLLPVGLIVAAIAALLVLSADAKFRISTTIQPTHPVTGRPARLIVRTEIALAKEHGIRLYAVGPWRRTSGQATFEVRLVRTGPRMVAGTIRFPYAGRWHLSVPASAASPPVDLWVRVRPRA